MRTYIRTILTAALLEAVAASSSFAQAGGLNGIFGGDRVGGLGAPTFEPGIYTNRDVGYTVQVPEGLTAMGIPLPEVSIWVADGRYERYAEDGAVAVQFMVPSLKGRL